MDKIDFLSSGGCSNDSKLLLACANGVPYALRLCTNCCSTTATSYINLATGVSSNTPPSGLSIGECADIVCPPVYETESFVATAGQTSFTLSHAPYKDVDFTRNGATLVDSVATVNGNTVTYESSENNNINLLDGDDITISYLYLDPSCSEQATNTVICFEFNEGSTVSNIKVVAVNNSVTYYEDGEKITNSARITEVEQLVLNATSDNVVCCPDCVLDVDVKTCYQIGADVYSAVTFNKVTTYYKNNVKLTSSSDITEAEDAIESATVDSIIDCSKSLLDSKMCYSLNGDDYSVVTVNGTVAYYKNKVLLTLQSDIDAASSLISTATYTDVVDCVEIPDYQTCYEYTEVEETTITYTNQLVYNELLNGGGFPGQPLYVKEIYFGNGFPPSIPILQLNNVVNYWNGTSLINETAFRQELIDSGFITFIQSQEPLLDTWNLTYTGGSVWIRLWDKDNVWPGTTKQLWFGASTNSDGSGPTQFFTSTPEVDTWTVTTTTTETYTFQVKVINGTKTWYEDSVEVTDPTRIAFIESKIPELTAENIVCCPDCGGGTVADGSETKVQAGTGTTVTGTGTTSDPYIVNATPANGSETKIQSGTNTTITGTGTTADPYIVNATGGTLENVYFSTTDPNTAGTTFSPNTPQDLNKLYISDVDGSTWIWNGTAYVSKTDNLKWQAIGNFAVINKNGQGTVSAGTLVTWENINQSYGSLVVPQLASETLLLKAGYIYEIDVALQASFANSGSYWNYAIYSGTSSGTQNTQIGTPGKIRPNTETFANGMFDINAQAFVVANVDTYVSVKGTGGSATALNSYEGATYFKAKVIGVI